MLNGLTLRLTGAGPIDGSVVARMRPTRRARIPAKIQSPYPEVASPED